MEITILILKIILKVLEDTAIASAVRGISEESGVDFNTLWSKVPSKYKKTEQF